MSAVRTPVSSNTSRATASSRLSPGSTKPASVEFMPVIQRVCSVSGYATPSTWRVETDRGDTTLVLNAEEDIRRLAPPTLMIMDSRGIQFLIRNPLNLDAASRRILDRFL